MEKSIGGGMNFFLKIYKTIRFFKRTHKKERNKFKTSTLLGIPKKLTNIKLDIRKMSNTVTASIIHSFDALHYVFFLSRI
jgi:hypothetical protein